MAFAELIEKGGDADFLKDVLAFSLHRLMDMEAEAACGAGLHERSAERINIPCSPENPKILRRNDTEVV